MIRWCVNAHCPLVSTVILHLSGSFVNLIDGILFNWYYILIEQRFQYFLFEEVFLMAKITLEQKEQRLKALEQKIREEKRKTNEKLGKEIILSLELPYSSVDKQKIKELCDNLKSHYSISSSENNG